MKHYLHIWALLMLFIHLSSLATINFLPGERAGVSVRRVCLRQESKAALIAPSTSSPGFKRLLFKETDEKGAPVSKTEVKVCSVKLFCTTATEPVAYLNPLLRYEEPAFKEASYQSFTATLDPDPPRFG